MTSLLPYVIFIPLFIAQAFVPGRVGSQWYGAVDFSHVTPGQWVKVEVRWDYVEYTRGVYAWNARQDYDLDLLYRYGHPLMILFHNSPAWARSEPYNCRLPDVAYWDDYGTFILAAIDRYRPQAIEIWNEPEAGISDGALMWCCGCVEEPQELVDLYAYLYPIIKAAHPEVVILGGALTQADTAWAREFLAAHPRMDALSWHYYSWHKDGQTSASTAGLTARRDQLTSLGYTTQWLTETAHVCSLTVCGDEFRAVQAKWMQAVAGVPGFEVLIWYTTPFVNWAGCNMIDGAVEYPVWDAFEAVSHD